MKNEIIRAAVLEEAKKYGLIDELLLKGLPKGLDEQAEGLEVVNGSVSRLKVRAIVAQWRTQMPHYFNVPDASKMSDTEFENLEDDLREPERRGMSGPAPDFIRKIDASQLDANEEAALRAVLCGDKSTYHLGVMEAAARRQGIDVAPVAA